MMTAQNKARIAAIASIILTHLVTPLGTSDRWPRFRASFMEPAPGETLEKPLGIEDKEDNRAVGAQGLVKGTLAGAFCLGGPQC
jgi:hypothetical protein